MWHNEQTIPKTHEYIPMYNISSDSSDSRETDSNEMSPVQPGLISFESVPFDSTGTRTDQSLTNVSSLTTSIRQQDSDSLETTPSYIVPLASVDSPKPQPSSDDSVGSAQTIVSPDPTDSPEPQPGPSNVSSSENEIFLTPLRNEQEKSLETVILNSSSSENEVFIKPQKSELKKIHSDMEKGLGEGESTEASGFLDSSLSATVFIPQKSSSPKKGKNKKQKTLFTMKLRNRKK